MKYEVYLVRYASIVVEADNRGEATEKAVVLLDNGYEVSTDTDWNIDYVEEKVD